MCDAVMHTAASYQYVGISVASLFIKKTNEVTVENAVFIEPRMVAATRLRSHFLRNMHLPYFCRRFNHDLIFRYGSFPSHPSLSVCFVRYRCHSLCAM